MTATGVGERSKSCVLKRQCCPNLGNIEVGVFSKDFRRIATFAERSYSIGSERVQTNRVLSEIRSLPDITIPIELNQAIFLVGGNRGMVFY